MVFKRALDVNYHLKLKASRALFSEINTRSAHVCMYVCTLVVCLVVAREIGLDRASRAGVKISAQFLKVLHTHLILYG